MSEFENCIKNVLTIPPKMLKQMIEDFRPNESIWKVKNV